MTQTSIILIDDHKLVRAGLRLLLQSAPGLDVVGEAGSISEACMLATKLSPAMTVLDLDLAAHDDPIANIERIRAASETTRILVLTAIHDPSLHERAVVAGVAGIVLKDYAADTLLNAIRTIAAGGVWLDPYVAARALTRLRSNSDEMSEDNRHIASLTPREQEVVVVASEGLSNSEMARRLFISEATIRHHLTSIFAKLGVGGRLELIVYAYRHGLAKPRT